MRIIAFVGADGSGKTTHAKTLVAKLTAMGFQAKYVRPVFMVFNPWHLMRSTDSSLSLSPRMRRMRMESSQSGKALIHLTAAMIGVFGYLYAAIAYCYLRTLLGREEFIVCDRYFYQYFYDLFGPGGAESIALSFPRPDFIIWLDGSIELICSRIDRPPCHEGEIDYLKSVIRTYRNLSRPLAFIRIDVDMDERSIADAVWRTIIGEVGSCET